MNIKCQSCQNRLTSFSELMFKSSLKKELICNNCGAVHKLNIAIIIIPMLLGFLANMLILALMPDQSSLYIQFFIAISLTLFLSIWRPLVIVSSTSAKVGPIKWYYSPILYMSVIFCLAVFFMFSK